MKFKLHLSRIVEEVATIEVEAPSREALLKKLGLEEFDAPKKDWEYHTISEYPIVTHVDNEYLDDFLRGGSDCPEK